MSVFITTPHEWIDSLMKSLVIASQDSIELSPDSFDDLMLLGEATGSFLLWAYHDYPDPVKMAGTLDDVVQGFHIRELSYDVLYQYMLDIMSFHHSTLKMCLDEREFHQCEPAIVSTPQGWRLVGWFLSFT